MENNIFADKIVDYDKVLRCSEFELIILQVKIIKKKQYFHSEITDFYVVEIIKINPKSRKIKFVNHFHIDKSDYDIYITSNKIPVYVKYFKKENLIVTINKITNKGIKSSIVNIFNYENLELVEKFITKKHIIFNNLLLEFNSNYINFKTKFDAELFFIQTFYNDNYNNDELAFFERINKIAKKDSEIKDSTKHHDFENIFEPYHIYTPFEWKTIISKNKIFGYKIIDDKGTGIRRNLYKEAFISVTKNCWSDEIILDLITEKDALSIKLVNEIAKLSIIENDLYLKRQIQNKKNLKPAKFDDPFPQHPEAWDNID